MERKVKLTKSADEIPGIEGRMFIDKKLVFFIDTTVLERRVLW